MDTTTAIHELIKRSDRCCFAVLGSPTTWESVLVELGADGGLSPAVLSDAHARGYVFAGVWGLNTSDEVTHVAEPGSASAAIMLSSSVTFGRLLYERYGPQSIAKTDAVDWLTKLFQIPDMRDN